MNKNLLYTIIFSAITVGIVYGAIWFSDTMFGTENPEPINTVYFQNSNNQMFTRVNSNEIVVLKDSSGNYTLLDTTELKERYYQP